MVRLEDLSGQQAAVYNYLIAASKLKNRSVSNFYRHKYLTSIVASDGFNARFLNALNDSVVLRALQTLSSPGVDALRSIVLPTKQIPRRPRTTRPTGKPKQLPDNPKSADVDPACIVVIAIGDGGRTPEYSYQFLTDFEELENSPVFDTRPNSCPTPPPIVQRQVCSKKRKFETVRRDNPSVARETRSRKRIRLEEQPESGDSPSSKDLSDPARRQLFESPPDVFSCSVCSRFTCTVENELRRHVRKSHGFKCPQCRRVAHRQATAAFEHWRLEHFPSRLLRGLSPGECVPAVHLSTTKLPAFHALVTDRPSPSRRWLAAFSPRCKLSRSASHESLLDLRPIWCPDEKTVSKWRREYDWSIEYQKLQIDKIINGMFPSHLFEQEMQTQMPSTEKFVEIDCSSPDIVGEDSSGSEEEELPEDLVDLELPKMDFREDIYLMQFCTARG